MTIFRGAPLSSSEAEFNGDHDCEKTFLRSLSRFRSFDKHIIGLLSIPSHFWKPFWFWL